MRATLILTDDEGKKVTVVDKTLSPKVNGRGNTSLLTTGFGVDTGVKYRGEAVYLGLNLGTRHGAATRSLVD